METWKPVIGLGVDGKYEVSNYGNVKSLKTGKIMKPYVNNSGYKCIKLSIAKNNKLNMTIHRLVALHFCKGYKKGLHVNHKDGNRLNNNADNLEWVTVKENIQDTIKRGTHDVYSAQQVAWVNNQKPVAMLDLKGNIVDTFPSIKDAVKQTGSLQSKISLVCAGKRKTTNGYKWRFIDRDKEIV